MSPYGLSALSGDNDLDDEIPNLFSVIRDRHDELARAVELTPYAKAEINRIGPDADPVERARRFLAHNFMTYVGEAPFRRFVMDQANQHINRWRRLPGALRQFVEPLRRAIIRRQDAISLIWKFAGVGTLFVVDPPYLGKERHYREVFDRHIELFDLLNTIEAAGVIVTHDQHPMLVEHLPADRWHAVGVPIRTASPYRLQQPLRTELILTRRAIPVSKGDMARCACCGAAFTVARSGARFCSQACRQKAYRARNGAKIRVRAPARPIDPFGGE